MQSGDAGQTGVRNRAAWGDRWAAPASGFLGAVLVIVVWRMLHWPFLRETSGGVLFFLMTFVSAYRAGRIRTHPVSSLSFVAIFTVLGVAMGHIPV